MPSNLDLTVAEMQSMDSRRLREIRDQLGEEWKAVNAEYRQWERKMDRAPIGPALDEAFDEKGRTGTLKDRIEVQQKSIDRVLRERRQNQGDRAPRSGSTERIPPSTKPGGSGLADRVAALERKVADLERRLPG